MTPPTLTLEQTREMTRHGSSFRAMCKQLPDWDDTPFTPSEMAARGVPHRTIVRAFLRPDVLGDAFGETVCRVAETVLPVFEDASPADNRPCAAIEAARVCFVNPSADNVALAAEAETEAREAVRDAVMGASWLMGGAASARAVRAAAWSAATAARVAWSAAWADAAWAATWAVRAGCPPATVLRIIEGASQ